MDVCQGHWTRRGVASRKMSTKLDVEREFPDRLKLAAGHMKVAYSASAIAAFLGIKNRQTVHTWMAGSLPRADKMFEYADKFGVDARWLATGKGEMLRSVGSVAVKADEAQLLADYRTASDAWKLTVRLLVRTPPEDQAELSAGMNILMTTIFGKAVPDDRLGDKWKRPDASKSREKG